MVTTPVTLPPIEPCDQTRLNRVTAEAKHDRDRRGCGFGRERRWRAAHRGHDNHLAADQIGGHFRQSIIFIARPPVFDCDVAALGIAGFSQAFAEARRALVSGAPASRYPITDIAGCCTRHERPRGRTADKRYELAASHCPMPPVLG
jgi:hypothetical protein